MRREVVVLDTEVSAFGHHADHDLLTCAARTLATLLSRHLDVVPGIDAAVAGCSRGQASQGRENGLAQSILGRVGLHGVPGFDVKAFCATGNLAVIEAASMIESGRADIAVAVGVEHLSQAVGRGPLVPETVTGSAREIFNPAVLYALSADRYLADHGVSAEVLAQVTVHSRLRARHNENARFREPVTVDQVLSSREVAPPLTLLQCCPNADGSGAALLVAGDVADALRLDLDAAIRMRGRGWSTAGDPDRCALTSFPEDRRSAELAYEEASLGPGDITVAEVHDAFSISAVLHVEDVGLARPGEGWRLFGPDRPADEVVLNPDGGLLSRGHPLGATGLAQIHAIRRHLARHGGLGLVQEAGGIQVLGQMLSSCMVFEPTSGRTRRV